MRPISFVGGVNLDEEARDQIARAWNWLRIAAALPALPMALAVAIFSTPKLYLGAALMAVVLAISIRQRHNPRPAALLALDTFGTWFVVELLGVPPAVLGIPFTVIWVAAWLTTAGRSRLAVMTAAAAAYAFAAFFEVFDVPSPDSVGARIIGAAVGAYYVTLLFSVLIATIEVFRSRQTALTEAHDELQRLVDSKDQFVASVSHELRTPLTEVVGFSSVLDGSWDEHEEADRRGMIRLIAEQSQDVAEIVEDLLTAARAEAGTLTIGIEDCDVLEVISPLAAMELIPVRTLESPAPALADPTRLRQVVRNLVTNALRYGGDERWLEVAQQGSTIHIRMCDNGPGISLPQPERMFEAYERGHNATGQPGSVGLGLSVAKTLVRLMDGDLTYRREGSVTIFECTLRAAPRVPAVSLPADSLAP
ncbi:MAG: HAMP domain-containing histidine kinase [Acidimicrobiia bacterium]|nr:HAMP domain-containing histidine kinase [Acidimicrobiia bacterium]